MLLGRTNQENLLRRDAKEEDLTQAQRRPNVVVLFPDQLRAQSLRLILPTWHSQISSICCFGLVCGYKRYFLTSLFFSL